MSESRTYDPKNILHGWNEDHQQVEDDQEREGNDGVTA